MKLWMKIYLFSLLLLIFTLNIGGYLLIQKLHNDLLKKEIDRCIADQRFVSVQLKINSMALEKIFNTYPEINTSISNLMEEYSSSFEHESANNGHIEILDSQNEILYTDMSFPHCDEKQELDNASQESANYIIRTIDNRQYLYVCSLADIYNSQIKVHFAKDISSIYEEKASQYSLFLKLSVMICSLFAVFMFFISRLITKPINILIKSNKKIIAGDYSERVQIKSNDEFKVLASNFNKMTETVEDKINELKESNDEKETLINNLTHELKTPLTSIIGYANIIRTSKYDEKLFFECADYIYKQGKRLEQMTFKMMDLIYSKNEQIKLEEQNIMPIIYEVKSMLAVKLNKKNIDLIIKGKDYRLNLDKDLISMALSNFVENAIKASKDDSKIYLKVFKMMDKVCISVEDSGVGIPKEHLDKIWQPFYVVDKARSRKNNGAGIGLSICRKIAEVHNADIKIESEVGVGTKITLMF